MWKRASEDHDDCIEGLMPTFFDDKFVVSVKTTNDITHLKIARLDGKPIDGWDDLQKIKNELCGPETQAIEIYPPESQLVNTFPVRHLWAFRNNKRLPIGYMFRATSFQQLAEALGSKPSE